jgi:hypothetical protein
VLSGDSIAIEPPERAIGGRGERTSAASARQPSGPGKSLGKP